MHLMRFIRSTYQASIVDFGRAVSIAALDSLPELETLYLLTTPDPMGVDRARRAIQSVEDRGFASNRLKVLLNRAGSAKADVDAIESALGRRCDAVFRNEPVALYEAYSEGRFLPPTSPLGKEFNALAVSIRERALGERDRVAKTAEAAPSGGKRWFSFLQKTPAVEKSPQGQGVQA
jgi:Flp pilus assembly CpaE family ATPase